MKIFRYKALAIAVIIFLSVPVSGAWVTAERIGKKINVTINGKLFTSYIFEDDEKYPFFFP